MAFSKKNHKKKSQSSMEFIMIFSFMMIVFAVVIGLLGEKYITIQRQKDFKILKQLSNKIKYELDFAYYTTPGYYRQIFIPKKIEGITYNIRLDKGKDLNPNNANFSVLKLTYNNELNTTTITFLPPNLIGNFKLGTNNISKNNTDICINTECN